MALTIDNLEIKIETEASKAARGTKALAKSLEGLNTALGNTSGLASNLQQISKALQGFSSVGKLNMKSKVTQIQKLNELIPTLGGGQGALLATNLKDIADGLTALSAVPKMNVGVGSLANGIQTLNAATSAFDTTRLAEFSTQMRGIADGLSQLSNVENNGVSSTVNALKKIPEITKDLDPTTINEFASTIQRLTEIMGPLATQMDIVGRGFSALPSSVRKANKAMNEATNVQNRLVSSQKGLLSSMASLVNKYRRLYGAMSSVLHIFSDWFDESNEFVETLNLFTVSMGDATDEAMAYAKTVSEIMGLDVAQWMQKQGMFMRTLTGFGVASEEATKMSKNLTQLGYDLSSFLNVPIDEAFDKLESGMTGQIKGLKEYGYNLSVAALKETALRLGIEQSWATMTEAQKAQLRYITLLQNSNGILGDMAKTIMTPANSLRILGAQIERMERALGNLVSVIAVKVIPWFMAFVELVEEFATALAEAWGYELPELPENDLKLSVDTDELEEANKEAEELKKQLMGFDELNILKSEKDEKKDPAYSLGIELPEYDFLSGLEALDLEKYKNVLKEVAEYVGVIGAGLLAWKVASNLLGTINDIRKGLDKFKAETIKKSIGITLMVVGFALEFKGAYDLGYEGVTLKNVLTTAIGAALGIAGSLLTLGTGPLGWAVGIGLAVTIGITGFALGYNKRKLEEDLNSRFGQLVLDAEEVLNVSKHLTTSELSINLELFVDEKNNLDSLKTQVENCIKEINRNNFRISLGMNVSAEDYTADIDSYVESAKGYMEQKQIVATLAIKTLFDEDVSIEGGTGQSLSEFASNFYGSAYVELEELGKDLKEVVANGFKDGKWIENYEEQAMALQQQIQEILDYIANVEFEAKLNSIKLDLGTDLTAESFTDVMGKSNELVEEQKKTLEQARLESLKIAEMQYDINIKSVEDGGKGMSIVDAEKIYDATVADIQREFTERKGELTSKVFGFGLETIMSAYKENMENSLLNMDDVFARYESGELDSRYLFSDLSSAMATNSYEKKNIKMLLEQLMPTAEEMEEMAKEYRALGEAVPENIQKGLSDVALLEALAGEADGINYLIGKKYSEDPSFLEALTQANLGGKAMNEEIANGFLDSTQVVVDAANGTVTLINDTIGKKTLEVTPNVAQNMKDLGINVVEGLYDGIEEKQNEKKSWWQSLCEWFSNLFKTKNEIHSPSALFERHGNNIIQGLWNGLENAWKELKKWWQGLELPSIKFKMPHFEWDTKNAIEASGVVKKALELLNLPTSIPTLKVNWYASGGFPSMGEMFIARESGPELVGRIGNKNAVVNNQQIISGIASAVYNAMMAAKEDGEGSGGTARIIVQIGDQAVGEASVRYINGQIVQTGASPIYA